MTKLYSKTVLSRRRERVPFPSDFRFTDHVREIGGNGNNHVYEFIGTGDFGAEWITRRNYEVQSGREEEPILYTPIYDEVRDPSLPKFVDTYELGPAGVVLTQLNEGGEIKFATVGMGQRAVEIIHYAVGLEYSKDIVVFNQTWNVSIVERQLGIAYNALLNHVHLNPIVAAVYPAGNQTPGNSGGDTLVEDYMLTIEDAVVASRTATPARRGPFGLLVSTANLITVQKALSRVPQQVTERQSTDVLNDIRYLVAYDGWTGNMGGEITTYPGVTAGKAYLISSQYRMQDFRSWMKQDLLNQGEEQDISRLMTQTVWDTYFGVYANPLNAVEEITWPVPA